MVRSYICDALDWEKTRDRYDAVLSRRRCTNPRAKSPQRIDKTQEQKRTEAQRKPEESHNSEPGPTEPVEVVPPKDIAVLTSLAGEKFAQDLVKLFQGTMGENDQEMTQVKSGPLDDKSKRGQIHGEIRRIFQSKIGTTTDDSGAIIALKSWKKKNKRKPRGTRAETDATPAGEYLHFTLYKDNRDTMDAVNQIARMLRARPQAVGYAGTKDRRASTSQRCSVRHANKRALAGTNGKIWGVATGNYEYRDEPIHLGQLRGNEFVITLKNCAIVGNGAENSVSERLETMKANVQKAMEHMAAHGWINYFGHQRFGTHQVGTHQIGQLILADKMEQAVLAVLSYDPEIAQKAADGLLPTEATKRDEYLRHQACMLYKTGQDPEKAVKLIPPRYSAETCVLRHLTRQGNGSQKDHSGALVHITRGLRSMYLHAYQSYVWNHTASRRWQQHGGTVIKGDLVIAEAGAVPPAGEENQDEDDDGIVHPIDDEDEAAVRARPLSEEEASSGRFTIHDVVLPTPGYDVIYPDNEIGEFYKEFMGRHENGGLDPTNMRRRRREFSLPGRYRKLMNRFLAPPTISFKLYSEDTEQMHPTDLDIVKATTRGNDSKRKRRDDEEGAEGVSGKRAKAEGATAEAVDECVKDEAAPVAEVGDGGEREAPEPEPTKIAAIVKFQLGSSAYATVTLRELMGDVPDADGTLSETAA
ncbi:pseudouridine synthase TruD/Pus7 [Drechmeria coniospora]|uniref:Pseudouridine synthase TruD/Pus7 n=1 Tax=Drechmeria coniospora TaxID=98403 RepID=A0A151GSH0_DRECN|nr:pseudouridine synthase TruD/Pus7 [Drechmeria coniospora]KYK60030.1 pseudouridine synthase TruD/Pus7 [Drechmeria coniospora]